MTSLGELNRRQALALLTGAAGASATGLWSTLLGAAQSRATLRPPAGAIIRTILKDLPPSGVGAGHVLFHEHLSFGANLLREDASSQRPGAHGAAHDYGGGEP